MVSEIFYNDFIRITFIFDDVYIESFKQGFSEEELMKILKKHPEIVLTSPNTLKNCIVNAPKSSEKFGELRNEIDIEISEDKLTAYVIFYIRNPNDLHHSNRDILFAKVLNQAKKFKILYGIKKEYLLGNLSNGIKYAFAIGISPKDGIDSIITYYKFEEPLPTLDDDGKVNFYELNLINLVKENTWVGERIDPTDGTPGKSIFDEIIPCNKGKMLPLNYDKKTIYEKREDNKTVLYSLIPGAVNILGNKISISNHLDIIGDVDLTTGNILFDGYVTIHGTIKEGFKVEATNDIEILSIYGVSNIKSIISIKGNIFIRGGVISKHPVFIKCEQNLFAKYLDNVIVECNEKVNSGYYIKDSNITAKEIILESSKGAIIGGYLKANFKVSASIIGSEIEKKTTIEILGFSRADFVNELTLCKEKLVEFNKEFRRLLTLIKYFESLRELDKYQKNDLQNSIEQLNNIKKNTKVFEDKKNQYIEYLKTKGDGEVTASIKFYPNVKIIIKDKFIEINKTISSTSFCYHNNTIKEL